MIEIGTTEHGGVVLMEEAMTDEVKSEIVDATATDGWKSRKLIAALGSAGATMAAAFAFLWFGRMSEGGAINLVEASLLLVGGYCGVNLVEQLGGLAALVMGKAKPPQ